MKAGQILYFKAAKNSMKRRDYAQFKGHGVGLMLGEVPQFARGVTEDAVMKTMVILGFVRIDALEEVLGKQEANALIEKVTAKYFPRAEPHASEGEAINGPLAP